VRAVAFEAAEIEKRQCCATGRSAGLGERVNPIKSMLYNVSLNTGCRGLLDFHPAVLTISVRSSEGPLF